MLVGNLMRRCVTPIVTMIVWYWCEHHTHYHSNISFAAFASNFTIHLDACLCELSHCSPVAGRLSRYGDDLLLDLWSALFYKVSALRLMPFESVNSHYHKLLEFSSSFFVLYRFGFCIRCRASDCVALLLCNVCFVKQACHTTISNQQPTAVLYICRAIQS